MVRRKKGLRVNVLKRGTDGPSKEWVEATVREAVRKMFSTRMANTLTIRVEVRKTTLQKGNAGEAAYNRIYDPKRKEYTIRLKSDLREGFTRVIVHELKHVEQYAQRRLKTRMMYGKPGWLFRCEEDTKSNFYPHQDLPPWHLRPWEQEAMAAERKYAEAVKKAVALTA